MRDPSFWRSSLGTIGVGLAALLLPGLAAAQIGAGALTGTNTYAGREEGDTIPIDLTTGGFGETLPFDVTFKISGKMPARFGRGSRVDARFVEFERPPDCASFFNQYTLTRQRLSDLNDTDAIPVRRRRRSVAVETSGFRQATVFDASGSTLAAGLKPLSAAAPEAAAAATAQGASFLVDFPALRPNHYYCFQFISRRALSKEDLEKLHVEFQKAVDEELRKEKYTLERPGGYTTFKVDVEDYENMRVTLSAVIEEKLASEDQVVLAPQDSFFNVGAELGDITARYREDFEKIAVKTVGERLIAIRNFDNQMKFAVGALRRIAERTFEVPNPDDEDAPLKVTGLELVLARADRPGVADFMQKLRDAGIEPGELVSFSDEQLKDRFKGVPFEERATAPALEDVWDVEEVQRRIDSLQNLSRSLEALIPLAAEAKISLTGRQVNATPISETRVVEARTHRDGRKKKADALAAIKANPNDLTINPGKLSPTQIAEMESKTLKELAAADKLLSDLEAQLEKGNVVPRVNLVYQATRFLGDAVTNLRSLQGVLKTRSNDIGQWVRQVLVEEQASLVVGGTTVADYDTRAIWYMSADIGSGISELEDFFTYVGWNIYLRPVNKKAHLSWGARPFGIGEEIMRRFSFTLGVVQTGFDERDGQFMGVIGGNAAVMGAGFRINDSLRFSVGGLVFESQDPDPLVNSSKLEWSPYMAISLDWNIGASLSGLLPGG